MKKILAVGALLAMGTMAMGTAATPVEIDLGITIVDPLTLTVDSTELTFADTTLAGVQGSEKSTNFEITGANGLDVGIKMQTTDTLKNTVDASQVIPFDMYIGDDLANNEAIIVRTLGGDGEAERKVNDTLKVVLGAAPNNKNAIGTYEGKITMNVNYN